MSISIATSPHIPKAKGKQGKTIATSPHIPKAKPTSILIETIKHI